MAEMTAEEKQARADARASKLQEDAYNKAMINTPPAPKPKSETVKKMAKGGVVPRGQGMARSKACKMR